MIFAVINLQFALIDSQFAVIDKEFAVIDLQNFGLLWNDLQPFFLVDNHFTAHCEMIFAVINLQFAVINLQFAMISIQFAVIDLQNFGLLWNDLQPFFMSHNKGRDFFVR